MTKQKSEPVKSILSDEFQNRMNEEAEKTRITLENIGNQANQDWENSELRKRFDSIAENLELSKKIMAESNQNWIQYELNKLRSDF